MTPTEWDRRYTEAIGNLAKCIAEAVAEDGPNAPTADDWLNQVAEDLEAEVEKLNK